MGGNPLNGGRNSFLLGLAMAGIGVGLTVASQVLAVALGLGVSFVFYGLIIAGIIRMATAVPSLMFGDGDVEQRRRRGRRMAQAYVAPPSQMPQGLCWMCGGKVRRGNSICLHCGAAQPAAARDETETSRLSGYDPNAGELITFLPSDGPAAATPYPSAPYPVATPGGPPPGYGSQWGPQVPQPPQAPGGVWRPAPEEMNWNDEPEKRPRWRRR
jgi:hypothetical protein